MEGLEGKEISAINSRDVLYTLNDAALAEIIDYGRPDAGMNPFGRAYNPEGLSKSEIDYIVTFMRYFWDDRFETARRGAQAALPAAGREPGAFLRGPHRAHRQALLHLLSPRGQRQQQLHDDHLREILNTGDEAPVITAKDLNSILLTTLQGTPYMDPNDPNTELVRRCRPAKPSRRASLTCSSAG